ncbi:MAG TPA: hypothetical protein VFI49_13720, partial [Rudaea sp.]|nr:hypothetical protein [Rudaea sp.]
MMSSRILLLAACCALMPSAWAGAGLTSAGVDPTVGNNNAQQEPTLAQVAPVANQGQGTASTGVNAAVPNPAVAGANAPQTANGAADGAKTAAAPVVVAPAPPPPPPDPSTLPVSV